MGLWSVLVSTELASHRRELSVLSHSPARLEVRVLTPLSVSASLSSITGVITANYTHTGLPVCGNLTITAITSDINGTVLLTKVRRGGESQLNFIIHCFVSARLEIKSDIF